MLELKCNNHAVRNPSLVAMGLGPKEPPELRQSGHSTLKFTAGVAVGLDDGMDAPVCLRHIGALVFIGVGAGLQKLAPIAWRGLPTCAVWGRCVETCPFPRFGPPSVP